MLSNIQIESVRKYVIDAGKIILSASENNLMISQKTSNKDLVTQYDREVQSYLMDNISVLIPDAVFFSEESENDCDLMSDNLFIIDPIDGTTNFIHGLNKSAVSVAWYKNGMPYYGIVYNPFVNELFEALKDNGAYLNSKEIHASNLSISKSVVAFGTSPYNSETTDRTFEIIKNIYGKCQDIRRFGSAALDICYVACGHIGLYFEAALSIWDYAAAWLILAEAGGLLVDFNGNVIPLSEHKTSVVAGNAAIIEECGIISKG